MKWVLIGHRGVGKTSLLKRMQKYFPQNTLDFFDLDQEISKQYGKSITQIFEDLGEEQFREIEKKVFTDLINHHSQFILSVGAGFQLKNIPHNCRVLWVRRKTDQFGRIFFNRPRLNKKVSAIDEFFERYPLRQESYAAHSHLQYLMPEGIEQPHETEEKTLKLLMDEHSFPKMTGVLTILPQHLKQEVLTSLLPMSVDNFELRDDLLSAENILRLSQIFPKAKILLSFRKEIPDPLLIELSRQEVLWDWADELGNCSFGKPPIRSYHQMSVKELAGKTFPSKTHLKISPEINSFLDLKIFLDWQLADPENRSILPRTGGSENSKWTWLRLWLKGRQKLNFFKIDEGSAKDQPSLYEWIAQKLKAEHFAAVLGHPVFHSRTPVEQQEFFKNKNWPVYAVDIKEQEFTEAFSLLENLGLKAAAVTSPLKNLAAQISKDQSPTVQKFQSANTLYRDSLWSSENTDLDGFKALAHHNLAGENDSIAIWGGGGTLPVVAEILPRAVTYSVRSGEMRDLDIDSQEFIRQKLEGPRILIWAAGPDAQPPIKDWKPEKVIDLNYREDSLAREYALEVNAQYIDGLLMFHKQAEKQRDFWDQF